MKSSKRHVSFILLISFKDLKKNCDFLRYDLKFSERGVFDTMINSKLTIVSLT